MCNGMAAKLANGLSKQLYIILDLLHSALQTKDRLCKLLARWCMSYRGLCTPLLLLHLYLTLLLHHLFPNTTLHVLSSVLVIHSAPCTTLNHYFSLLLTIAKSTIPPKNHYLKNKLLTPYNN